MVQTFAPNTADQSFSIRILPGRLRCRYDFFNAHSCNPKAKMFSVDRIAISQQKAARGLLREGFNDLLSGPEGSWVGCHIEVDHLPSIMKQDDEAVQNFESHSRHYEKINCYNLAGMILNKTLPGLRRWPTNSDPILGQR